MKLRLLMLALGTFAVGVDGFVIAGLLVPIAKDLDVSPAAAGQLLTVFALGYAILSPTLAAITAKVDRKHVILSGLAIFALANALTAIAPNYEIALLARIIAAAGAAMIVPNGTAVAVALAEKGKTGMAISIVYGGMSGGSALGVPIGVWLGSDHWRLTMWFVAAIGAVAWIGVSIGLPKVTIPMPSRLRDRIVPLKNPRVLAALATTVLVLGAGFTTSTYVAPIFLPATEGSSGRLAILLWITGVMGVIGNLLAGRLTDRFGVRPVLFSGIVVSTIVLSLTPLATHSLGTAALWALIGAIPWLVTTSQQQRMIQLSPENAPVVLGLNGSAVFVGSSLGDALGGAALSFGGTNAIAFTATSLSIIALAFTALTYRSAKSQAVEPESAMVG